MSNFGVSDKRGVKNIDFSFSLEIASRQRCRMIAFCPKTYSRDILSKLSIILLNVDGDE